MEIHEFSFNWVAVMKRNVVLLCGVFILLQQAPLRAFSQAETTCPAIVQTALATAGEACTGLGRNQACYGNVTLEAEPQEGFSNFTFSAPGDLVDVSSVKTLQLSPLQENSEVWGVALMRLQANLPDTLPGQNVTFVLFGDVELQNAVGTNAEPVTIEVTAPNGVNVRALPSTNAGIRDSLSAGETVLADGRLEDNSWFHIIIPGETEVTGWVAGDLLIPNGDIETLAILSPEGEFPPPLYRPMQAFYLSTGVGDAPCAEAPDSGLLIQTPEGSRQIILQVNEAIVRLSSTAYLQAQAGGEMVVNVIEGQGQVEAEGAIQIVPAGTRVRVPLDVNLAASGQPTPAEPYDAAEFAALPLSLLERDIEIAQPLTDEEIEVATAPIAARLVPDFYARYGCVSFNGNLLISNIDTPDVYQEVKNYPGCASIYSMSYYDFLSGRFDLAEVQLDGTITISWVSSYNRTFPSTFSPESLYTFTASETVPIVIALDNRVFSVPGLRMADGRFLADWELVPIGTEIIEILGQQVEALVYQGEWSDYFGNFHRREQSIYHYDYISGILLRAELIAVYDECTNCNPGVVQFPLTSSHGIWELFETNQPLAVVQPE